MLASYLTAEPGPSGSSLPTADDLDAGQFAAEYGRLKDQVESMEQRLRKSEQRRRALLHLIGDVNEANKRLANQRKAMLHILADYESDRRRLAQQAERLDSSRRALLHILQDSHRSKLRLEDSRKAMIHIMGDLRETTDEVQRREQELREKQEQLVQAGKLATLGELTTGVAHELNNPLNNIGLFIGNVVDLIELRTLDNDRMLHDLSKAMEQVRKASQIISHLRTFGRAAPASREQVSVKSILLQALSLLDEQLRVRNIEVSQHFCREDAMVMGNAIQLEQVFLNLLTNARDALAESREKRITIDCSVDGTTVSIRFRDTGPGIPVGLERRIFDPFFTTKEVGAGTGLGLSITYGIVRDHQGTISLESQPGHGAAFLIDLPLVAADSNETKPEAAA
jgi:C4-dicarboxylate-specific signal transduction histidine kinase